MATTTQMITDLDFDDIKASLQAYLQAQTQFTDYDFEGSGLVQLLNILSLNTHYNAYLANASFNETFLDTAIKRANVVSRAKEIGYTSRSARSATALVNINISDPTQTPVSISLDKFSPFTSTINNTDFTFYNIESVSTPLVDGAYDFTGVKLYEGRLITNTFVYDGVSAPYFTIPNEAVDMTTLSVVVQNSLTDTFVQPYNYTNEIIGVTATTPVFFVQESAQELYQVYFGDGVIGQALTAGNVISITYLVSSLDAANVSSTKYNQIFSYSGDIGGNTNIVVSTASNSIGGADKEDAPSIQFNAPLSLARANRIITTDDYLSAIGEQSSSVQAVSVWGGEDNVPPVYGKVFISLKPFDGYVISQAVQDDITNNILATQGNKLVTPVFVDPEYIYLTINVQSTYDPNLTTVSSDDIEGYITDTINTYFTTELGKYQKQFYFSRLSRLIDETNDSLISNIMSMTIQKRMTFPYNYPQSISMDFAMPLTPGSLGSNVFTYSTGSQMNIASQFVDDSQGNVSVQDWTTLKIISPNVGTVDYMTGIVTVNNFVITGLLGGVEDIRINVAPKQAVTDIDASRNQIILIDDSTKTTVANIASGLTVSVVSQ
jgi:hypothetical protein